MSAIVDPMQTYRRCWKFLKLLMMIGVAVQQLPSATAESLQPLTCSVTRQTNGSFKYLLSRPPWSSSCQFRDTFWEYKNKTVVAQNSKLDFPRALSLTELSIILGHCEDCLHYTDDCDGEFVEVHCTVNCSLLSNVTHFPTTVNYSLLSNVTHFPTTVNSTSICLVGNWCMSHLAFGLLIGGVLLLVVAFGCWKLISYCQRRRNRRNGPAVNAVSYSPVKEQIQPVV